MMAVKIMQSLMHCSSSSAPHISLNLSFSLSGQDANSWLILMRTMIRSRSGDNGFAKPLLKSYRNTTPDVTKAPSARLIAENDDRATSEKRDSTVSLGREQQEARSVERSLMIETGVISCHKPVDQLGFS